MSCGATVGPTRGSQVEKLFSAEPPWILRWWDLSLGSYAIFNYCRLSCLLWVWERQIQSHAYVGRSILSCLAIETVLDMRLVWNASIISDIRTTSIYNPGFTPKGWEHHLNIQGQKGRIRTPILVIPQVQPSLSLAKATALSAISPRIPVEVCYCSFFVYFHCGWKLSVCLGFIIWLRHPTNKTTHSANMNAPTPPDHQGLLNFREWALLHSPK